MVPHPDAGDVDVVVALIDAHEVGRHALLRVDRHSLHHLARPGTTLGHTRAVHHVHELIGLVDIGVAGAGLWAGAARVGDGEVDEVEVVVDAHAVHGPCRPKVRASPVAQ